MTPGDAKVLDFLSTAFSFRRAYACINNTDMYIIPWSSRNSTYRSEALDIYGRTLVAKPLARHLTSFHALHARKSHKMMCIEIGTRQNPCRVKIIGPTLGLIVGAVAAVFCWPAGALVYCCSHDTGRKLFSTPVSTYQNVGGAIPI